MLVQTVDRAVGTPAAAITGSVGDVALIASAVDGVAAIRAARYTPAGGWGAMVELQGADATFTGDPAVAVDDAGEAVVAWTQGAANIANVWARRQGTDGTWQAPVLLEHDDAHVDPAHAPPTIYHHAYAPQVAVDNDGGATVAWWQGYEGNIQVWAARSTAASGWSARAAVPGGEGGHGVITTGSLVADTVLESVRAGLADSDDYIMREDVASATDLVAMLLVSFLYDRERATSSARPYLFDQDAAAILWQSPDAPPPGARIRLADGAEITPDPDGYFTLGTTGFRIRATPTPRGSSRWTGPTCGPARRPAGGRPSTARSTGDARGGGRTRDSPPRRPGGRSSARR